MNIEEQELQGQTTDWLTDEKSARREAFAQRMRRFSPIHQLRWAVIKRDFRDRNPGAQFPLAPPWTITYKDILWARSVSVRRNLEEVYVLKTIEDEAKVVTLEGFVETAERVLDEGKTAKWNRDVQYAKDWFGDITDAEAAEWCDKPHRQALTWKRERDALKAELDNLRTAIVRYGRADASLHAIDDQEAIAEWDNADEALLQLARELDGET